MRQSEIGRQTVIPAIVLTAIMLLWAHFKAPWFALQGEMGLCLPSPNLWQFDATLSWIINTILLGATGIAVYFINKAYNFVNRDYALLPSVLLVMICSVPIVTMRLNSGTLLLATMTAALAILFDCYKSGNATRAFFIAATLFSIGSMFQYAFLLIGVSLIPVGLILKCFRWRELAAFLMGIIAPYWIVVGLGIIPVEAFKVPVLTNLFDNFDTSTELFVIAVNIGITTFLGLIIGLNCAVRLYAGNTQRRIYHNAISVAGIMAAVCMCVDFTNITAYLPLLYFACATQIANMYVLWNFRKPGIWLGFMGIMYLTLLLLC